jgi:hypothetical protein
MTRRSRITRGVLAAAAAAWMLALPASTMPAQAQASWRFQLEWNQTGGRPSYFQLCANGTCTVLGDARHVQGTVWRASLPMMPPGEYRLVLEACGAECVAGSPDLMIRVMPASPRRPPIDVIEGPRIPVSR